MAAPDCSSDGPSDPQDETLITQHTLTALDLRTAVWTVTLLPTEGPHGWSTRRLASSGAQDGAAPVARIDGAGTAIDGVGLIVFGGVGDDFGFVPATDAWLLRHGTDVRPRRRIARVHAADSASTTTTREHATAPSATACTPSTSAPPSTALAASASTNTAHDSAASPSAPHAAASSMVGAGPCPRACLCMCADGMRVYIYGGFDGETDLCDLWGLDLQPAPARGHALRPPGRSGAVVGGTTSGTMCGTAAPPGAPFDVGLFKERQARATAALNQSAGAARSPSSTRATPELHSSYTRATPELRRRNPSSAGVPLHVLVGLAARSADCVDGATSVNGACFVNGACCVDGATSVGQGTLPLVPPTPATAPPAELECSVGLGDGRDRAQRASPSCMLELSRNAISEHVLAAFRQ